MKFLALIDIDGSTILNALRAETPGVTLAAVAGQSVVEITVQDFALGDDILLKKWNGAAVVDHLEA